MGLFDRVERKLESAVNGAFARAFRAEVQPVEIASAMRRAMDDRAAVISKGRTVVPNLFVIDLSPTDHERLTSYADMLSDELVASVAEHADQQGYVPGGPFHVEFRAREDLETGVFRVRPATSKQLPGGDEPGVADHEADRRRREHSEELRRAHPFRVNEAEAAASGQAGLASHAASAAAGSLAGTAAAGRESAPGLYGEYGGRGPGGSDPYGDQRYDAPSYGPAAYEEPRRPAEPPREQWEYGANPYDAAGQYDAGAAYHDRGSEARRGGRYGEEYGDQSWREPAAAAGAVRPDPPRPAADARPWLESKHGHYPLLGAITVMGRDPGADITLEDAGISRRHAEIRVTNDGRRFSISVRDLGSTNGTFVNGDRISSQYVEDGDRITLGRLSLIVREARR
ncbi:hypothetical protein KEM60_00411 [Austwickia sp. TVS 96-490-7B]|uniref:FhaA domain-containing protein n=1 Tax=Austwickia sp. TVS 96-490-7B TaxID=2830843 RepID=UPI001D929FA8|nr:DUF3662 and FHA domain-containing protein [Austwickia sp. TVS 96-490-7B]MBW3084225.1 hypothetical protein [Austwickia sp. TVS 96-490-7B]